MRRSRRSSMRLIAERTFEGRRPREHSCFTEMRRDELSADRQTTGAADRQGHRGNAGRFAVAVKMSLRYISYGSEIAPSLKAGVGVVGVNSRSTPSPNTSAKSFVIKPRT